MTQNTISVFVTTFIAFVSLTGTVVQAGRSCSDAHNQCKKYCASSGNTNSCPNLCKNRFNSCKRTGTFIWTSSPVEKGLERR